MRSYKHFGHFVFRNQGKLFFSAFLVECLISWAIDAADLGESIGGRLFGAFLLLVPLVLTYLLDRYAQRIVYQEFRQRYTEPDSLGRRVTVGRVPQTDAERLLGVSRDASPQSIKEAYWKAAKRCHPDYAARNHMSVVVATKEFQRLQAAYESIRP